MPINPSPQPSIKETCKENLSATDEGIASVGMQAWRNLFGGWLVLFCVLGYMNSFGVYQDYYTRSSHMSASTASWIGSVGLCLTASLGIISGRLLDRGYFRISFLGGSVLYIFAMFMLSLADPEHYYQVFLSQGLGLGIGAGFVYIPSIAVQSHHWGRFRTLAVGIQLTGSSCGGIIFPIMINRLLAQGVSFAWAVRATAFVATTMLVTANVMLMPRNEIGGEKNNRHPSLWALLKDIPYVLIFTGSFFCLWGIFYPYFYIQLYSTNLGINPMVAFYTVAVVNASSIPGRVIPVLLVDKLGCFNLTIACGLGTAATIFGLYAVHSLAGVLVFSILSGFFSGGWLTLATSATASFARGPEEVGQVSQLPRTPYSASADDLRRFRLGVAFALGDIASLTGTPIVGALLGSDFSWSRTIIFSGVSLVAGSVIIAISREWVVRKHESQIV